MVEDVVKCHFCGKHYSSAASCDRHIKGVHQNLRPFKCSVCGQAFKQSSHRDTHQRKVHVSVRNKPHKSRNHLSGFARKGRLTVRLPMLIRKSHSTSRLSLFNRKNVAARTCDVCQRVFAFRQGMMTHRKLHFEKGGAVRFPKISRGHIEQAMGGENNKETKLQMTVAVDVHKENDTRGDHQDKSDCDKDESQTSNFSTSTYTCKRCNESFTSRSLLAKHLHATHLKKSTPLIQNIGKKFTCDICQQSFQYRFVMLRHRRGHFSKKVGNKGGSNSEDDVNSETKHKQLKCAHLVGEFSCDICHRVFSFRSSMMRHRQLHTQNNKGPKQSQTTTDSSDKMTNDKSKFRCGICHKHFSDWSTLLKHRWLHFSKKINHVENDPLSVDSVNSNETDTSSVKSRSGGSDSGIDNDSDTQHIVNSDKEEKTPSQSAIDKDLTEGGESVTSASTDPSIDKASHEKTVTLRNGRGDVPCTICGKTYSTLFNMQKHRKKKHPKPSYPKTIVNLNGDCREKVDEMLHSTEGTNCLICHATFTRHGNLVNHVERVHLNKRQYNCRFCNYKSRYKSTLKMHTQRQHHREGISQPFQYQASNCTYGRGLSWHAARGFKKIPERQSRTCPLCLSVFSTKGNMEKHVRQVHGSEPRSLYRKSELQQDLSEIPELIKISVNHSEDTVTKDDPQPHITKKKLPAVDRICGVCRKVFFSRRAMLIHKARAHLKGTEALVNTEKLMKTKILDGQLSKYQNDRKPDSQQDRTSDVFGKPFTFRSEMLRHRRFSHPTAKVNAVKNQEAEKAPPQELKVPDELTQDKSNRINEMLKSDYIETVCTICDKDLHHKRFLESHVNAVHLKLKPYQCSHCERAFGHKSNLNAHIKDVHSNGTGNETGDDSSADDCNTHRSVDTIEPPKKVLEKNIECDICKKLFITNFAMLRHKRNHKSDKTLPERVAQRVTTGLLKGNHTPGGTQTPFQREKDKSPISTSTYNCKTCSKSFISRSLLVKHRHAAHAKKWRYKCAKCGKPFMRRDHLQNHMRNIHGGVPNTSIDYHSKYDTTSATGDLPKPPLILTISKSSNMNTQSSISSEPAVEICKSRHHNSSGTCEAASKPSIASSPSVKSSSSITRMKLYRCTICNQIFTESGDWREHLAQHLGGGTKKVYLGSANCDSIPCEDGEERTENKWSYTCPSCKVEIEGSFNLVMHIKGHMRLM